MFGDHFGMGDCDCPEHGVERAIRKAAAEKLLASMLAEYGDTWHFDEFPLWSFPSYEWVCRAFPSRSSRACPGCGYVPSTVPSAFTFGTVFGLKGSTYRVVSVGSTNRYSPRGQHFEDYVTAELVKAEPWSLPDCPAPVADVASALHVLFHDLPKFRSFELADALVTVSG